jgi:hypothetical protein
VADVIGVLPWHYLSQREKTVQRLRSQALINLAT